MSERGGRDKSSLCRLITLTTCVLGTVSVMLLCLMRAGADVWLVRGTAADTRLVGFTCPILSQCQQSRSKIRAREEEDQSETRHPLLKPGLDNGTEMTKASAGYWWRLRPNKGLLQKIRASRHYPSSSLLRHS